MHPTRYTPAMTAWGGSDPVKQKRCSAGCPFYPLKCDTGDMLSPGQEPITVSMQLGDGNSADFYGALADFGPLFEAGCSVPSSNDTCSSGASSSSSRNGSVSDGAPPAQQQAEQQPPQPQEPLRWRGRELSVQQGGPPGGEWRVVYVVGVEHSGGASSGQQEGEEDDDPYEDPEGGRWMF